MSASKHVREEGRKNKMTKAASKGVSRIVLEGKKVCFRERVPPVCSPPSVESGKISDGSVGRPQAHERTTCFHGEMLQMGMHRSLLAN